MINKRLLRECSSRRLYLPMSIAASIFNSFIIVINAYLLAFIVDSVFLKKKGFPSVRNYIVLLIVNACVKALISFLLECSIKNMAEDIKEEIKEKTFNRIVSSNPLKIRSERVGGLISTVTEGVEMLTPYFSQYVPQLFYSAIIPIVLFIAAALADRLSAFIMLITYPIIPIFMVLIGYKSKEVNERQWKTLNVLSSHFVEMLQGLSTLKAFGGDKLQEEKVYSVSEDYRKSTMEVLRVSFLSALVLEMSATISIAVIAVNLGLRLVYDKISFLNAFFILILAPDFYLPLRQLGFKFHASLNGQVAIEKIEELEKKLDDNSTEIGRLEIERDHIEIEVNNLTFSHEDREALNNVSFKINPGEKVALVGESGSGKSTLINILCGFLRVQDGSVFINGSDINNINRESYINRISIVPQFPHIFNKSIEDNVLLGSKVTGYNETLTIYRAVKLDSLAKELKDGYKTIIGDGEEAALSGGEKQRISIARAMIKDADLIIMDEPTSALDAETEEMMYELISGPLKNKTVLLSAHRLNTVRKADKILVLKVGCLVECGTHEQLMLSKGPYYRMIKTVEEGMYENI